MAKDFINGKRTRFGINGHALVTSVLTPLTQVVVAGSLTCKR